MSPTPEEQEAAKQLFFTGLDALKAQQYASAETHFSNALRLMPDRPSLVANLLIALTAQGKLSEANPWAQRATELEPDNLQAWQTLLQLAESLELAEQARHGAANLCRLAPDDPGHWLSQARAQIRLQAYDDALLSLARALQLAPQSAPAHFLKASCLAQTERFSEALSAVDIGLSLAPDDAQAWTTRGTLLNTLDQPAEALASHDKAIALAPDLAAAWLGRGNSQSDLGDLAGAVASYEQALRLAPNDHVAWHNKGLALIDLYALDEAISSFNEAIRRLPDNAQTWHYRGQALHCALRLHEAIASYNTAQTLKADFPAARFDESLCHLLLGDFAQGWPKYEARWDAHELSLRPHQNVPPLVSLEGLAGKRVLVWHEQGLGDTLQFYRYAPQLAALGAQVTCEVQAPLHALLADLDPAIAVISSTQDGRHAFPAHCFDAQVPLMSLPALLGPHIGDAIPAPTRVSALPELYDKWRPRLAPASAGKLRVGIACSGYRPNRSHRSRAIPLACFKPLVELADLYLIQTELDDCDHASLSALPVTWLRDGLESFQDTAAIVEQMDLIITMDTSLTHVAGAMGQPVWVLLPVVPDWRWQLAREDSPWYPSARLFRQSAPGDWAELFMRVHRALADFQPVGARQPVPSN